MLNKDLRPVPITTQISKMVSKLSKTVDSTDIKSEQLSDLHKAHFKEVSSKYLTMFD